MTRTPALLALLALALLSLAPAPTATAAPIVCLGSSCPGGWLLCADGDAAAAVDCIADTLPRMDCPQVQWLDESVGPVRVTGGGCKVQAFVDGQPVLP